MHQTRFQIDYPFRTITNHESVLCRESLANKLARSNPNKCWQEIRTMNISKSRSLPIAVLKVYLGNMLYMSYGRVILGGLSMLYR